MGSTKFEGGSITKVLQVKQVKLPKPKITISYKRILSVTMFTTYTKDTKIHKLDTKIHKIQQDVSDLHT